MAHSTRIPNWDRFLLRSRRGVMGMHSGLFSHCNTSALTTSALHVHAHPCTIPCSHSSLTFRQAPLADRRHHPTAHTPARYAERRSMCSMTTFDACCSASYGFLLVSLC